MSMSKTKKYSVSKKMKTAKQMYKGGAYQQGEGVAANEKEKRSMMSRCKEVVKTGIAELLDSCPSYEGQYLFACTTKSDVKNFNKRLFQENNNENLNENSTPVDYDVTNITPMDTPDIYKWNIKSATESQKITIHKNNRKYLVTIKKSLEKFGGYLVDSIYCLEVVIPKSQRVPLKKKSDGSYPKAGEIIHFHGKNRNGMVYNYKAVNTKNKQKFADVALPQILTYNVPREGKTGDIVRLPFNGIDYYAVVERSGPNQCQISDINYSDYVTAENESDKHSKKSVNEDNNTDSEPTSTKRSESALMLDKLGEGIYAELNAKNITLDDAIIDKLSKKIVLLIGKKL